MVKTYSKSKDGKNNITQNFQITEFACKDGTDSILLDDNLPKVLQRIRELTGNKAITITSGYRTPEYNKKISGAANSYHTKGMAADITISGISTVDICRAAETALSEHKISGGICLYTKQNFVHVDTREAKWRGQDDGDGRGAKNVSGWPPVSNPINPINPTSYDVRITGVPLNIRTGAGTNHPICGTIKDKGIFTIIEEATGAGATKWGKLKAEQNGIQAGWISLDFTERA